MKKYSSGVGKVKVKVKSKSKKCSPAIFLYRFLKYTDMQ